MKKIEKEKLADRKVREMYTKAPFPFISIEDFEKFRINFLDTLTGIVDLDDLKNKRILDAGCGTGEKSCILAEFAKEVVGVDASPESIRRAVDNSARLNLDNTHFIQDSLLSLNKLDGEENSFDVVFCSGVLHHLSDPYLGFKNVIKYLKPNGLLIISFYHKHGDFHYWWKYNLIKLLGGPADDKKIALAQKLFYPKSNIIDPYVRAKIYDTYIHPQVDFFSVNYIYKNWLLPNNIVLNNVYAKYSNIRFILKGVTKLSLKIKLIDLWYSLRQKGFVFISGRREG